MSTSSFAGVSKVSIHMNMKSMESRGETKDAANDWDMCSVGLKINFACHIAVPGLQLNNWQTIKNLEKYLM